MSSEICTYKSSRMCHQKSVRNSCASQMCSRSVLQPLSHIYDHERTPVRTTRSADFTQRTVALARERAGSNNYVFTNQLDELPKDVVFHSNKRRYPPSYASPPPEVLGQFRASMTRDSRLGLRAEAQVLEIQEREVPQLDPRSSHHRRGTVTSSQLRICDSIPMHHTLIWSPCI